MMVYAEHLRREGLVGAAAAVQKEAVDGTTGIAAPSSGGLQPQNGGLEVCLGCRSCGNLPGNCRCPSFAAEYTCAVCMLLVRGIATMCPFCGHGGHTAHLHQWFATSDECPTGCGCKCTGAGTEFHKRVQQEHKHTASDQAQTARSRRGNRELNVAGAALADLHEGTLDFPSEFDQDAGMFGVFDFDASLFGAEEFDTGAADRMYEPVTAAEPVVSKPRARHTAMFGGLPHFRFAQQAHAQAPQPSNSPEQYNHEMLDEGYGVIGGGDDMYFNELGYR
jgi:hypothetical protein